MVVVPDRRPTTNYDLLRSRFHSTHASTSVRRQPAGDTPYMQEFEGGSEKEDAVPGLDDH